MRIDRRIRIAAVAATLALAAAGARADEDEGSMGGGAGGPAPAKPADPAPAPVAAGEDVLVLSDGRELRGRITAEDEHSYAVKVGGAVRLVPKDGVKEVRRGAPVPDAPPAAGDPAAPKPDAKPDAKKDRRARRKAADPAAPGADAMDAPAAPPLSETAAAWARICIDRFLGEDAAVRRSAADALRALGPAVAPLVREAAAKAGEAGKYALEELARSAEARGAKRPEVAPEGAPAPDGRAPSRARAVFDRVRTELGLDESQAATVGARLLEYGRDVREATMDARDGLISYEDARAKAGELRTKLRESLTAELTTEQLSKLDGILDSLTPGAKGGKKAPPPKEKDPAPGQ